MRFPLRAIGDCVFKIRQTNPAHNLPTEQFYYIDLSSVDKDEKRIVNELVQWIIWANAPSRARQIVQEGDVLISTVRPNLNGVAIVESKYDGAISSTGFCVLRAIPEILNSRYLFHWVCSSKFVNDMVRLATGASYPAVSDRIIHESLIPLPSIDEQQQFAVLLDKADAIRKKRREALKLADEFLRSVFLDIFGDPVTNPKGWPKTNLKSLTTKIGSGATPLGGDSVYQNSGVSFIRSMNIYDGDFFKKDLAYLDNMQADKLSNVEVRSGDLLLNITGASVARSCLVPDEILALWHLAG